MKLTKLQRYTAYCIMLDAAENPCVMEHPITYQDRITTSCGLCFMFNLLFGSDEMYHFGSRLLPELHKKIKQFPTNLRSGDWELSGPRIAALKQCIKETEPK